MLDALGKIVGVAGESLRKAGSLPAPGPLRMDEAAVFTRTTQAAARHDARRRPQGAPAAAEEWDEVDRLFRGR